MDYVYERMLEFVNDKSIIVHYFEERNPEEIEQYNEHMIEYFYKNANRMNSSKINFYKTYFKDSWEKYEKKYCV